ncbi:hypothetical protein [Qipengyuania gelatinilytica]|uniref:DUF2846 domain-containing protein n=1 Tax=Qipengyuania gelatinilytica TaxID=2867231 RepID=A0ABX9A4Y1_9SPHN|nr:hypothetical protein [Qipengyuania gelatinilytica]QZD96332.1 hypothetical protein K3136_06525 [Qipengyuania gelatinilytica]
MKIFAFLAALAGIQAHPQDAGTCIRTFSHGDELEVVLPSEEMMPRLVVKNDNSGFAFVRLRGIDSAQLRTVFVEAGRTVTLENIVPGRYEILVAYRGSLAADCHNFAGGQLERFEGVYEFERIKETEQTSEGTITKISATVGEITLYEVEDGNVETKEVSLEYFNQP